MNAKKKSPEPIQKARTPDVKTKEFAFGSKNYRLLILGLLFILVGFLLMIGGGSDDPAVFNYKIFSFRRITLAPILILAGFIMEIFAIMRKTKED
ncbi:MAG TPA: DUF3098 domain-containing protein [Bacteroidales bacterium]|nr:DUF3098 domain-containing protein [Bacteroidales bacterium]HNS46037.1 DUF3098 domain-containing protein [Bacteroidales bacterium]